MRIRCANLVRRATAVVLALLVAVSAVGMPRAKAVVAQEVGRMTCQAFLESLGLNQVVSGTAADGLGAVANRGITSVAGRYVAATGVSSTASGFFASIAPYVTAFAGGFVIGYTGYTLVSNFVDWLIDDYGLSSVSTPVQVFSDTSSIITSWEGREFIVGSLSEGDYTFTELFESMGTIIPNGKHTFGGNSEIPRYAVTVSHSEDGDGSLQVVDEWTSSRSYSSGADIYGYIFNQYPVSGGDFCIATIYKDGANYEVVFGTSDMYDTPSNWYLESRSESMTITGVPDFEMPVVSPEQEYRVDVGAPPGTSLDDLVTMVPEQIGDGTIVSTGTVATPGEDTPPTSDVPTINPNPPASEETPEDVKPATVQLGMVFPFCIPFDVYHMVTLLVAEPVAPNGKWEFSLPWDSSRVYSVEWDLEDFDDVASLLRTMELIVFAVGLAAVTRRFIKW